MTPTNTPPTGPTPIPYIETQDYLLNVILQVALVGLQGRINAYYIDSDRDPYYVGGARLVSTPIDWTADRIIYQHIADSILRGAAFEAPPGIGNYIIRQQQLDQILTDLAEYDVDTIPTADPLHDLTADIHHQIRDTFHTYTDAYIPALDGTPAIDISIILRYLDIAFYEHPTTKQ